MLLLQHRQTGVLPETRAPGCTKSKGNAKVRGGTGFWKLKRQGLGSRAFWK